MAKVIRIFTIACCAIQSHRIKENGRGCLIILYINIEAAKRNGMDTDDRNGR